MRAVARLPSWTDSRAACHEDKGHWHATAARMANRGRRAIREAISASGASEQEPLVRLPRLLPRAHHAAMTPRLRLTRRRVVVGAALVALVVIAVEWTWALRTMDPEPHQAVLDELHIPVAWELAHQEIVQNILFGSRVERYYLVDADPTDVVSPAESILGAAGFTIEIQRAPRDWCDTRPLAATPAIACPEKAIPTCSTNGPGGPITCRLLADRGDECLAVTALDRGEMATYFRGRDAYHISDPVRIVVLVTDYYPGPSPCHPSSLSVAQPSPTALPVDRIPATAASVHRRDDARLRTDHVRVPRLAVGSHGSGP